MIYRRKHNIKSIFISLLSLPKLDKKYKVILNCQKITINRRKFLNDYSINTNIKMSRIVTKKIRRGNK